MANPVNRFKHSETAYNRPNQKFACGHECDGKACALGPDAKGRCRGDFVTQYGRRAGECIPAKGQYNRVTGETTQEDRWFCSRDPALGGRCEDGPLPDGSCCLPLTPCHPTKSLRHQRGTLTLLLAGLTFALVLILFANRPESLSHPLNPGPITSVHSTAQTTCATCHRQPAEALGALSALPKYHGDRAFLDAHQCAICHHEIGAGKKEHLFTAHTLPQDYLAKLTQKAEKRPPATVPVMVSLASRVGVDKRKIACASCHQEHQGAQADLRHMSNAQCQVCHTGPFHSFSQGHPEFTSYPYHRRTHHFFDHETHFNEYFKTDEFKQFAKNACTDCHSEQTGGGKMLTGTFEDSCADCHHANTTVGSWDILAFPRIDTARMADQLEPELAEKLARWDSASGREISSLLRILLGQQHREVESLYPLRRATEEEKQAAAAVAQTLVEEIYPEGSAGTLGQRLRESALLEDVEPDQAERLGTNLVEVFTNLRAAARDSEEPVVSTTDSGGTFTYDPVEGALSYQPSGHGDLLMKSILDVAAAKVEEVPEALDLLGAAGDHWQGYDTTGAGKCLKCHTLDRRDDGSMRINWSHTARELAARPMTKFKHRSHVRLPELVRQDQVLANEACASCHQLETRPEHVQAYRKSFAAGHHDPHLFRSGFQPLMLNHCTQCHTQERAGDSCLQCHQYHATESPLLPILGTDFAIEPIVAVPITDPDEENTPQQEEDDTEVENEDEGDSLIPEDEGSDLLIPENEGSNLLIPEEEGSDLLIPEDEDDGKGESLIPAAGDAEDEDEGESLLPPE